MAVMGATKAVCGVSALLLLALTTTAAGATTAGSVSGAPAAAMDGAAARWGFRLDGRGGRPTPGPTCASATGAPPAPTPACA